ncbi:Protein of unknown function [Pilibacter termitis]|uniref:Uncharacterized protein n=1 Tax=Pilibacter termitis TaxID=263852 RepID=A0A1T4PW96_9ENTE|nr:DUF3013 family protein [Pilibacter termitis]SJZ95762.1 Protein of unknown function [Pilibacter termitis]
MAKETMMNVLEELIEAKLNNFDVTIEWHPSMQTIELTVTLFAENKENVALADKEAIESQENVIAFEDSVVLYNQTRVKNLSNDVLFSLPYEDKKGIQRAYLSALIETLQEVLVNGQDQLLDFLEETAMLSKIESMNDEEIKEYFQSLDENEKEKLLQILNVEEAEFSLEWDEKMFEQELTNALATDKGKEMVVAPKF